MKFFLTLICSLILTLSWAQSSLLSKGQWARFIIRENGMYRLRGADLQAAGLSLNDILPGQVRVAGFPGGPVDQVIQSGPPPRLQEMAVLILDGEDNRFDPQDEIIFFAEGPDHLTETPDGPEYAFNPYSRENYVFVGITPEADGLRVQPMAEMVSGGNEIRSFRDVQAYEPSLTNLLGSGRKWYGQVLKNGASRDFDFIIPGPDAGGEVVVTSAVMAQSFSPVTFTLSLNGAVAGSQNVDAVPDFKNPPSNNPYEFSVKGKENIARFTTAAPAGGSLQVRLTFESSGSGTADGYLDYLIVEADRALDFAAPSLVFYGSGPGAFHVSFSQQAPVVWDITDFRDPAQLVTDNNGSEVIFEDSRAGGHRYAAFQPGSLPVPEQAGLVPNQDLPASGPADLLIVTHPDFLVAAEKLARHRAQFDDYSVVVATTEQIFNEYAGGRQDVSAVRNLARELYVKGGLDHVLLMGKGTYDYLGVLNVTANYVPIYQSRNSLEPLDSYASDDFYGFLEEGEGQWAEAPGGNHTLDVGVGRLPVTTLEEALNVTEKIMRYDLSKNSLGEWRSRLVFVADDEDFNLHHRQAERLAIYADSNYVQFRNKKIYLGSFPQEAGAGGQRIPAANKAINDMIWQGSLVLNYTGHGGEDGWAQERVLTRQMIREWQNRDRLPLFVTATCEFGRHDNPREASGGELVITQPFGGGIALLSTGRPVFSSSNFSVNRAFYAALFNLENGLAPTFGRIFQVTKNESIEDAIDINRVGNRNFTLLGDPSQRIAYPGQSLRIRSITGDGQATDTLRAGARIRVEAEVLTASGLRDNTFNGTADILVSDQPVQRQTLNDPVFNYQTRENIIFKGQASVAEGSMEFEFIVPRNISQKPGTGRIQIYALSDGHDALGASDSIFTGGTSAIPAADTRGPDIAVYFGDSTNTSRSDVNDNTLMFISLDDESGINVSGFAAGNNLTAELDGQTYILNEYYTARKDDPASGWVVFPLTDLEKGKHTLTIRAWDVYNNSGSLTVEFAVADPGSLVLKNVMNYPQPVVENTTFRFDHNRAGETLEVEWTLIGRQGQLIERRSCVIENSPSRVELTHWSDQDRSKNLIPGIYFYSVIVRSTLDGASAKKYQKLILID